MPHSLLVAAGLLGWCAGAYSAFILTWTLLKKSRPKHAQKWMNWVASWNERRRKMQGWMRANEWPISLIFSVLILSGVVYSARHQYPIVEEHNVAVYQRLSDGDWAMSSDEEGKFAYRPCSDDAINTNTMLKKGIGYIASRASWEERGDCKSIRATGLGFYWRDEHFQYRRIADERASR